MKLMPLVPAWIIAILLIAVIALLVWCLVDKKRRKVDNFRRIGMLFVMMMILLHPVIRGGFNEAQLTNLNVYFLVDNTNSMTAKDCDYSEKRRFEKVKQDIKDVARQFPGAQYAVIAQDISTYYAMPLSTSMDTLFAYADALWPKPSSYSTGSNSSELIDKALDIIKRYDEDHPERLNVLFYMGDGEDTNVSSTISHAQLKKHLATGAVFGYGTKDGALLYEMEYLNRKEFSESFSIPDVDGHPHSSKIDETALQGIANKLGVKYYNRTNNKVPDTLSSEITSDVELIGTQDVDSYTEIYWIITLIFIGLLLWDFYVVLTRILQEREVK